MHCQRHTPYFYKANLCNQLLVPKIDFISNLAQSLIPVILSMFFRFCFGFNYYYFISRYKKIEEGKGLGFWVFFFLKSPHLTGGKINANTLI